MQMVLEGKVDGRLRCSKGFENKNSLQATLQNVERGNFTQVVVQKAV